MSQSLKYCLLIAAMVFIISCKQKKEPEAETTTEEKVAIEINGIPESWIKTRVEKAEKRLTASDAGTVIWNAMEAHGGLEKWHTNGALAMRFNYQPLDGSTQRDSYQVVDTWGNRSVHTSTMDSTATYGWTGSASWVKSKKPDFFKYDTKFWALTPLYLMGFPFVLDGDGVNLELLPPSNYQGKPNDVVKVTFAPGTGDAPDDYYILHFDAETHKLIGTRYIVSYPEYFKDGGHSPEKFMEVGPLTNVEGILLPTELKTHWTVNELPGNHITQIDITKLNFKDDLPEDFYAMPEGSKKL